MVILFKLIVITFIIAMGFKISMSSGMLFEKVGVFFERKVNEGYKIYEVFICQWCLPSICSIIAHIFAFGLAVLPFDFNWQLLIRWPLVICGASFLSGNTWNLYQTVNSIKERNELQSDFYFKKLKHLTDGNEQESGYKESSTEENNY